MTKKLEVRVSEGEKEVWRGAAEKAGMGMSEWARWVLNREAGCVAEGGGEVVKEGAENAPGRFGGYEGSGESCGEAGAGGSVVQPGVVERGGEVKNGGGGVTMGSLSKFYGG